jgi:lysozyme
METNDAGINLIKEFEGLRLKAYQDVAGIWTIGHGHIRTAIQGMEISIERAEELLKGDLKATEEGVTRALGDVPTTPHQFSAMVALAFNIGVNAFKGSTVLREHKAGNHQAAASAFLMWDKATINGKLQPVAGLARRRESERQLYLTA